MNKVIHFNSDSGRLCIDIDVNRRSVSLYAGGNNFKVEVPLPDFLEVAAAALDEGKRFYPEQ